LAAKNSPITNATTKDAHANWSPTPISAAPGFPHGGQPDRAGLVPIFGKKWQGLAGSSRRLACGARRIDQAMARPGDPFCCADCRHIKNGHGNVP
jgi:hypothetical protein